MVTAVVALAAAVCPLRALAQPVGDAAAAESLREEGSRLYKEGSYERARTKLEASLRLQRSRFTAGRLAQCYEKLDRLASAWVQWRAVVDMIGSTADARDLQRKAAAKERAAELDPRVPRLAVSVAENNRVPGLIVSRGGVEAASGTWGTPIRVDSGEYAIVASAPDHKPWSITISIQNGESKTVEVPRLEKLATEPISHEPEPATEPPAGPITQTIGAPPARSKKPRSSWVPRSAQAWTAVGLGAVGIASVAVGSYFGLDARRKRNDSRELGCDDTLCPTPAGLSVLEDARSRANLSTILFAVGVATIGGGVALWLTAPVDIVPTTGPPGIAMGSRF